MFEDYLRGLLGDKNQAGLYMAAETLCVLNAEPAKGSKGVRILGFAEIDGPNDLSELDSAKNQPLLDKIRNAFQKAAVTPKTVSLAVPSEGSMIRYFELPILPKKEEKNAVRFEAQKYVPFDIKDLYYDYESYPSVTQKKIGVVFFACKKQWVDMASSMLVSLGIQLEKVELVSQSVVRAFHYLQGKGSDLVEILVTPTDDKTAELILFKRSSVLMTRHLSLIRQPGAPSWDIPFFISEIRITLDYFYENFKEEKVGKIYLAVGAGEDARSLQDAIQKEFSLPMDHSSFPSFFENTQAVTPGMAAAYGLVLGQLFPGKGKQINLHPSDSSQAQALNWADEKKQLQDLVVKVVLGVAVFFFFVHLILSHIVSSAEAGLRNATAPYLKAENASIQESLQDLKLKETQLAEKVSFAGNLVDKRNFFTTKMNVMVRAIPGYIRLTSMKFSEDTGTRGAEDLSLHLDGYVISSQSGGDLSAVNKLVKKLLSDEGFMRGFADIKIGVTRRESYKGLPATRFGLDCVGAS